MLRTVDLSTEVFAPVIVGAIMTGFGLAVGGAAIAGWNVASLVVEYSLLHHLYHSNADLSKPKTNGVVSQGGNFCCFSLDMNIVKFKGFITTVKEYDSQ